MLISCCLRSVVQNHGILVEIYLFSTVNSEKFRLVEVSVDSKLHCLSVTGKIMSVQTTLPVGESALIFHAR